MRSVFRLPGGAHGLRCAIDSEAEALAVVDGFVGAAPKPARLPERSDRIDQDSSLLTVTVNVTAPPSGGNTSELPVIDP